MLPRTHLVMLLLSFVCISGSQEIKFLRFVCDHGLPFLGGGEQCRYKSSHSARIDPEESGDILPRSSSPLSEGNEVIVDFFLDGSPPSTSTGSTKDRNKDSRAAIALLILPGGSYERLASYQADIFPSELLKKNAIRRDMRPVVVRYRVPPSYLSAPYEDSSIVARFLLHLSTAEDSLPTRIQLGLKENFRLAVLGFSAGGHAAALFATRTLLDLTFVVLVYPVISFDRNITHSLSFQNFFRKQQLQLLDNTASSDGKNGEAKKNELVRRYSLENAVSSLRCSAVYLTHSRDDDVVGVEHSARMHRALLNSVGGPRVEFKEYPSGGHRRWTARNNTALLSFKWIEDMLNWMSLFSAR